MSGPKSSRYTLTPEQLRILREAQELERKKHKEYNKIQQNKTKLVHIVDELNTMLKDVDMLVERTGEAKDEQKSLSSAIRDITSQIDKANYVNNESSLDVLQQLSQQTKETIAKNISVHSDALKHQKDVRSAINSSISDSIDIGMNIRIYDEIQSCTSQSHLQEQKEKIKKSLNNLSVINDFEQLKSECNHIIFTTEKISSDDFIDNFYTMTVLPFIKKCRKYEELFVLHRDEFEELNSKYAFYSEKLGVTTQVKFSIEEIENLRENVKSLQAQYEKSEEQRYIAECIDEVMSEMGYNMVGSRNVTKKSGKKYRNELFHFSEGTVVNVTYASNGQISMELGGVDTCMREPSKYECDGLCEDMEEFCNDFQEIEQRLKKKGVVLANRISMLPPKESYAQIIDISDYDMKETVENYEHRSKHRTEQSQHAMRRT